jgi:hypothetical protein
VSVTQYEECNLSSIQGAAGGTAFFPTAFLGFALGGREGEWDVGGLAGVGCRNAAAEVRGGGGEGDEGGSDLASQAAPERGICIFRKKRRLR